jgi:flagellar basal-body rod protein FlgG
MIFEQSGTRSYDDAQAAPQGVWINVSQGKVTVTKRLLDCAIQGAGFFQVQRESGTFLTRCGRFVLDDQRRLAVPRSHGAPCPLEPAIVVPKDCERLQIQSTGQVVAVTKDEVSQTLGTIKLFGVLDPAALKPVGDNLFEATSSSGPATVLSATERGQVVQGSIEESNVDPAAERRKLDALAAQNAAI